MKVLVFPYDQNPYIKQLYSYMKKAHDLEIRYFPTHMNPNRLVSLVFMPFALVWLRIKGYSVFHLHFLYPFILSSHKTFSFVYIILFCFLVRLLGYKFIYTVHDISPHEPQTNNDLFITKFLCYMANHIVVISQQSIVELKKLGINQKNISIIPLGNYISTYPVNTNREEARQKLGLQPKSFVFLFFGLIRQYKGVSELLQAFEELVKEHKDIQLVIAGDVQDFKTGKKIEEFKKNHPQSIFHFNQYIKDEDVQYYFKSADIAVLPFQRVTNSSSVLLPLSLGLPALYPLLGNLKDIPDGIGITYTTDNENNLTKAMRKAITNKGSIESLGQNGLKYAQSLKWEDIAEEHYEIYR